MSHKFFKFLWDLEDAFKTGIVKSDEEEDYLTKYLFAKEFGWPPYVVDAIPYKDVIIFRHLIDVDRKNQENLMSKEVGYNERL